MGTFFGYILCFSIFPRVLRSVPLGTAYAIWSGVGTAATAMVGAVLFGERLTPPKLLALATIIAGVVGLNLASGGH